MKIYRGFFTVGVGAVCALGLACLNRPAARAMEISLPPETVQYASSNLPGYNAALAYCVTCHSADYIQYQPTSSRTYWKATVTKMQKTFGAPIPDAEIEPITDYLVKTYGAERAGAAKK